MHNPVVCGDYTDARGVRHEVIARESSEGLWEVVDVDQNTYHPKMIEVLREPGEGQEEAKAIGREYVRDLSSPRRTLADVAA